MEDGLQDPLWPFRVLGHAFGLTNAPATFEGYINNIMAEKLNVFVIVYLDDILIYTKSEGEEHVQAVR